MSNEADVVSDEPVADEPQPGVLCGNVHQLPAPSAPRALARTLEALQPSAAEIAERRVLERLKPLHEQLVARIEQHEQMMRDCERRLRALESK